MKMFYVVNTKHDADAYRVYARVHMDGRVTLVNRVISLVAGLLIIVGLLTLAGKPIGLLRMRNRLMKSADDIQTTFDYRFGDNAFDVSYPGDSMSFAYGSVSRIVETEAYFFVYTDKRMAHILPKKHFAQGDAKSFGAFISEKTGVPVTWHKAR